MADNFVLNDMSGTLWANDYKDKDSQPSHKGSIKIDGVEYWMSAWVKEARNGKKFFSMAFTRKEDKYQDNQSATGTTSNQASQDFDDDVPF